MKKKECVLWAVAFALAVGGCSSPKESDYSSEPKSQSVTNREVAEKPQSQPEVIPLTFSLTCYTDSWERAEIGSIEDAWAQENIASCSVTAVGEEITEKQREALNVAYPDGSSTDYSDIELLEILYGICAKPKPHLAINEGQLQETNGAAILCPNHPEIEGLQTGDEQAFADREARERGELIGDGKYLIGTEIVPGVWETTGRVEDCYWEISDDQGNIIDNNFVSVSEGLTVEISDWASGFTTEGCGAWRKQ